MILKILLVVGIIALVYFIYKKNKQSAINSKKDKESANEMVECAKCGIYCELNDTILNNNKHYCSKECLDKIK